MRNDERLEIARLVSGGWKRDEFLPGTADATRDEVRQQYGNPVKVEERGRFTWMYFRYTWGSDVVVLRDGLSWRTRSRIAKMPQLTGAMSYQYA